MSDSSYMSRAIQLAQKGVYTTQPNPRVGCVLVKDGEIVGEGWHEKAGEPHAEINALSQAGSKAQGATAYVTLEPCSHHGKTPPCADALIEAKVSRVVAAMVDPNPQVAGSGLKRLQDAGIVVASGVLEAQAAALNPGFVKRMTRGLPWIRVKLAMSLDGRTAMASGESKWITGADARRDVQLMRARSDAILTGSGTVIADDPSMNVRLSRAELGTHIDPVQPVRVIIDSALKTPQDAKMLGLPGQTLILTTQNKPGQYAQDGVETVTISETRGKVDLSEAMVFLASRELNEIHVEAGSELCGALLDQHLVDEIVIYMAPHIMGDSARGLFHLPGLSTMNQRVDLEIDDIRPIGRDWRITARPSFQE